jgi:hypothetical protein
MTTEIAHGDVVTRPLGTVVSGDIRNSASLEIRSRQFFPLQFSSVSPENRIVICEGKNSSIHKMRTHEYDLKETNQ